MPAAASQCLPSQLRIDGMCKRNVNWMIRKLYSSQQVVSRAIVYVADISGRSRDSLNTARVSHRQEPSGARRLFGSLGCGHPSPPPSERSHLSVPSLWSAACPPRSGAPLSPPLALPLQLLLEQEPLMSLTRQRRFLLQRR